MEPPTVSEIPISQVKEITSNSSYDVLEITLTEDIIEHQNTTYQIKFGNEEPVIDNVTGMSTYYGANSIQ